MITALSALIVLIVLWVLAMEAKALKPVRLALSPFWYFSFLFLLAFPLRAYLIDVYDIKIQVARGELADLVFEPHMLALSLGFATVLWACVYVGRRRTAFVETAPMDDTLIHLTTKTSRPRYLAGLGVLGVIAVVALLIVGDLFTTKFTGTQYQAARTGTGPIWVLPEIAFYGVFALFGVYLARAKDRLSWIDYAVFALVLVLTIWISLELYSRRFLAAVFLFAIILYVYKNHKMWLLAVGGILATVVASPLLDLLRRVIALNDAGSVQSWQQQISIIIERNFLYYVSGTFEGAGHTARLFSQASWQQLLIGVDQGLSWFYNAGLALVPRAIWEAKPLVYGGVAQYHWLYPQNFDGAYAQGVVPMSFAVDFSFGLGLVFALIVAYVFGRLLGVAERTFWDKSAHPAALALALLIFVYMFNWVRGGTIIVQSVVLFAVPAAMMLGVGPVLRAVFGFAGEAVGLAGPGTGRADKVFFYPHAYFRDRQLDTIRGWPRDKAVNADISDARMGEQVSRDKALGPARVSWKTRLPLVNVKRRPKGAAKDATVYVWGGLILNGSFITDIDNPYAFTAYNPFAAKLFRPLIRWFLESPRCVQIRCLSDACRDGVRREYGDIAYAKCVVAYPAMEPAVRAPRQQDAGRCKFLYVSTQFEIKGGEALLKTFERVVEQAPFAELVLVTHLPDRFQDLAAGVKNVHVFDANYTRDEIAETFLHDADVLVHPTYMDSFGMVILEAMSHGLPVIATDVYAVREMVEDGVNGYVIQPPVSIWSGTEPTELFSDIAKVQARVQRTDTTAFEDALFTAMTDMAQDVAFRERASRASLDKIHNRFARRA